MDKIKISCPECGTQLSVDPRAAGRKGKCPSCAEIMTIPNQSTVPEANPLINSQPKALMRKTKKCPFCGEEILLEAVKCKHCGEFLNASPQPSEPKQKKAMVTRPAGCVLQLVAAVLIIGGVLGLAGGETATGLVMILIGIPILYFGRQTKATMK